MNMSTTELILKFDPNTIEHLGISLYSKLPSVISELISNSWDADSDEINIDFRDQGEIKEIYYSDDGMGMTFSELNEKYLLIGRNRRRQGASLTPKGRSAIGKKGLGKLAVFGICNEVEICTVKDGIENRFSMHIKDIKSASSNSYKPKIISHNIPVQKNNGTEIWLRDVKRKSKFSTSDIAHGLSKKFLIFDALRVELRHNGVDPLEISNELKYDGFLKQFEWEFPKVEFGVEYKNWDKIKGKIFTLDTPVKDTEMKGIYLTSRGKIVNVADFYGLRDTDQFHSYVTGYLEIDFIDEVDEDLISTDRHSLNWEHDVTKELQTYLQKIIRKIGGEWKIKRARLKQENIEKKSQIDILKWQSGMPTYERELSQKIINPILENSDISVDESERIISNVIDKFDNKVFKDYASKIADNIDPEHIGKFLDLLNDWKAIEAKQISDLALARIEVITKFEEHLNMDTKEVPTLHNFLKKFSWLLDPRILEFRDEVTYSKLLSESFLESDQPPENKRIDFLCSNALGGVLYVIEIKRSKYKVDQKALEQAWEYQHFLKDKFATGSGFSTVVCYVVGGEKSSDSKFQSKLQTYEKSGEVFVKTYRELLEQSKQYHREFIDMYDQIKK